MSSCPLENTKNTIHYRCTLGCGHIGVDYTGIRCTFLRAREYLKSNIMVSTSILLWWFFLFYVLVLEIFLCCWRLMYVCMFLVKVTEWPPIGKIAAHSA